MPRASISSAACSGRPSCIRIIEPVAGLPRITIRVRPANDYGHPVTRHSAGSNHIRYVSEGSVIRVTTDAPLALIEREAPFVLTRPMHLVFGVDEPFPADLQTTCREFCDRTLDYWINWVRGLSISYDWQDEIIRAAITLKLSTFEETGGIIAAHTTSIPEAANSGRTWDYRYCWLRDAYFVVKALNRIGATQTMENFISFILSIASNRNEPLRPVYSVVHTEPMDERTAPELKRLSGRRSGSRRQCRRRSGPERHLWQRDPRGHADVLRPAAAAAGRRGAVSFARIARREGGAAGFGARQRHLGISRAAAASIPIRSRCAGRAATGSPPSPRGSASTSAPNIGTRSPARSTRRCSSEGWNEKRQAFTAAFGSDDLDASVLLLPDLGVVETDDPRFVSTVKAMERELLREKHVMRYAAADDFGLPATAFLICRFWLVDAWWSLGRREEARELFVDALAHRNRFGLLSEDIDPQTGTLWGNFPQTYSMAGLILTAMRLSRSWEDRYWRG